jgi:hypothetical protein
MRYETTPRTYKRGRTDLGQFRNQLVEWSEHNHDVMVDSRGLAWEEQDWLRITAEIDREAFGVPVSEELWAGMTRNAASQLLERMDGPSMRWFGDERHTDGDLRSDVFGDLVRHRQPKRFMMRLREDDQRTPPESYRTREATLRAVLSDSYTAYNHTHLLYALESGIKLMKGYDAEVFNAEIGDEMRAYVLFPGVTLGRDPRGGNGNGPQTGGGLHPAVYLSNSEIGTGRLRIHAAVFTGKCDNGAIVGWNQKASGLELIHRGLSVTTVHSAVTDAMAECLELSEEATKAFIASQHVRFEPTRLQNLAEKWGSKYGLTLPSIESWQALITKEAADEGRVLEPALFDAVNAATWLAGQREDGGEREQMERMAGDLLFAEIPENRLAVAA